MKVFIIIKKDLEFSLINKKKKWKKNNAKMSIKHKSKKSNKSNKNLLYHQS